MFGFIADILTSVTSIFFPIFASYKAIRSGDQAQLTPWLMYWTTLSLFLAVESLAYPIVSWFPFYSWIRLGAHLYLVLPGKQGSVFIYQTYIHPFLREHEREIDSFISKSHSHAKAAGLQYLQQMIEWAKVNVLGLPPRRPTPPSSRNVSYSSSLLERFNMPAARSSATPAPSAGASAGELFSLLGSAMQAATNQSSRSRSGQADDLAASGTLIPPSLSGQDKINYIATQRDRLRTLMQTFDNEASEAHGSGHSSSSDSPPRGAALRHSRQPSGGLSHSRSENEFEDLAYEDVPKRSPPAPTRQASWGKWVSRSVWGDYGEKDSATPGRKEQ